MAKALVLTLPGMADVCSAEVEMIAGRKGKQISEGVLFEGADDEILAVAYLSQSATRVLLVLSEGEKVLIPDEYKKGTISLSAQSNTKAEEIADELGIKRVYKKADNALYLHSENKQNWLGVDLTGDMTKRDYRIFIGSETLTGILAYGALALSGYSPEKTLLDPYCRAGSIVIEAALLATKRPPRFYSKQKINVNLFNKGAEVFRQHDDKITEKISGRIIAVSPQFPSVQSARKNAKIAGVVQAIDFSRVETEWIDLKYPEKNIDAIVTQPPESGKNIPETKFAKTVRQFFERTKPLLKTTGKITLVLRKGKDEYVAEAKKHGFSTEHERIIMQGKEEWKVVVLKPSSYVS